MYRPEDDPHFVPGIRPEIYRAIRNWLFGKGKVPATDENGTDGSETPDSSASQAYQEPDTQPTRPLTPEEKAFLMRRRQEEAERRRKQERSRREPEFSTEEGYVEDLLAGRDPQPRFEDDWVEDFLDRVEGPPIPPPDYGSGNN